MLTGRYPFRVGVYSNQDVDSYGVPSNFTMAPALLRELGDYATHAIGKWHLGFRSPELTPTWRGFDSFLVTGTAAPLATNTGASRTAKTCT